MTFIDFVLIAAVACFIGLIVVEAWRDSVKEREQTRRRAARRRPK